MASEIDTLLAMQRWRGGAQRRRLRRWYVRSGWVGLAVSDESSSSVEFGGRLGTREWGMSIRGSRV
jgi:hypothetical protein